jgi:hypothetical protein
VRKIKDKIVGRRALSLPPVSTRNLSIYLSIYLSPHRLERAFVPVWISTPFLRCSRAPRRRHRCASTRPFGRRSPKRSFGWRTASGRRSKSRALSFVPRLLQRSICCVCVLHAASSARLGTDSVLISVSSCSGGVGPLSSCRWRLARPHRVPPKWTRRRCRSWILTMGRPSTVAEARPPFLPPLFSPPPSPPPASGTVASPLVPAAPHLHALRRKRRHRHHRRHRRHRHRREAHPQRLGG